MSELGPPEAMAQPRIEQPVDQITGLRGISVEAEIEDRAKYGGADRLADDAHEHVRGSRDTALGPAHARLDRNHEGGIAEPHPDPDHERAEGGPGERTPGVEQDQRQAPGDQRQTADHGDETV